MNRRLSKFLTVLIVLLCLALLGGCVLLFLRFLPKKAADEVTSLETSSVFEQKEQTVEPEREQEYEGEIPENIGREDLPEADAAEPLPEVGTDEPTDAAVSETMTSMTEDEKLWQLFFVTPESLTDVTTATMAGDATKSAIEAMPVGGIIYFSANLETPEQVQLLLSNTQSYSKIPLFLGVDEEGGLVSRVCANEAFCDTPIPDAKTLGTDGDLSEIYGAGSTIARHLSQLGFNLDFAPVADVRSGSKSAIGNRSFSTDPKFCASYVSVMAQGISDGGVIPCAKHFPGYGAAQADAHDGATVIGKTMDELEACDLLPFRTLMEEQDIPFIMAGHASYTSIDPDGTPADCSYALITELLRNKMGYENVIITDSQQMASITDRYSAGDAAVAAIQAGCDMILIPADLRQAHDALADAVASGKISPERIDESVQRILTVKARYGLL